jgi:DNA-binding protein H-NS
MASINVAKLTLKELTTLQQKLVSAISIARSRESAEVKQKISDLASEHGFSVNELFGARPTNGKKTVGAAKYANPDDKSATWTGRGRKPNWLVAKLKKGASLEDFEI